MPLEIRLDLHRIAVITMLLWRGTFANCRCHLCILDMFPCLSDNCWVWFPPPVSVMSSVKFKKPALLSEQDLSLNGVVFFYPEIWEEPFVVWVNKYLLRSNENQCIAIQWKLQHSYWHSMHSLDRLISSLSITRGESLWFRLVFSIHERWGVSHSFSSPLTGVGQIFTFGQCLVLCVTNKRIAQTKTTLFLSSSHNLGQLLEYVLRRRSQLLMSTVHNSFMCDVE